jgi:glycosyltransferase involved in cell wall biosynthesis
VEALISGTPVLAARRGSLPELVPPDVGALLDTDSGWLKRLRAERLPWAPERCREWALERFHYARMAESYETTYARAIRGEPLNPEEPVAGDWRQEQ